jgi:hypothetical protein
MRVAWLIVATVVLLGGCGSHPEDLIACLRVALDGLRPIAEVRDEGRFLGKVQEDTARCRGGARAVARRAGPWVDWANYWATGDAGSRAPGGAIDVAHLGANARGVDGAVIDLEYQRVELIKFNLFDNSGTYRQYVSLGPYAGPALKVWPEMRLPRGHPQYEAVGGDAPAQRCWNELVRARTLTGICNDLDNPLMGSTGQLFARNVQFEATFPDLGKDELARNRHGGRIGLLTPDPQLISRALLRRPQAEPALCQDGHGLPGDPVEASCDYRKAPVFNVLAAFWIQFMTHDWFSHLDETGNPEPMPVGCDTRAAVALGCRPGDRVDRAAVAQAGDPPTFVHDGKTHLTRAYRTTRNTVTAWWDASQIYGYDERSRRRVKRDPRDPARLSLIALDGGRAGAGERQGYLPAFDASDPIRPQWAGQEAVAFPDNWTIGMSFYHNVFAREHNHFVDAFRAKAAADPAGDSGLRDPARPDRTIAYRDVSPDELFEAARLVIAALIAKIHTIEWTPQLLYDEPVALAMDANWNGLFHGDDVVQEALRKIVVRNFGASRDARKANQWYSVFASGAGIFGLGSVKYEDGARWPRRDDARRDRWRLRPEDVNGGVNHFGSPFNFPEEFVTVYRLHPLVPDLIELRQWDDANAIRNKVGVVATLRGRATAAMRERGLASWALSLGRQRVGALTLQNHPRFLQDLDVPRLPGSTGKLDVVALDLIRDRERGVPRFNEFRRQYGLAQLTGFDDFVDPRLAWGSPERAAQERLVGLLREIYGQHRCDAAKPITAAQRNADGSRIDDCLGHPDGTLVDNVEDVDTVVGWLAEFRRPHGFAISETQFQVFILNASRRLFSDRFFTSSFRPEFYTHLGVEWVTHNGPGGKMMEGGRPNGRVVEVAPLKRVLMRTIPELSPELAHVVNTFDPWARDRGEYYSTAWKPRPGAEGDPAFRPER